MDPAYPYLNKPHNFVIWLRERLQEIPNIEWDDNVTPIHSSYEDWYVWGTRVSSESLSSEKTSVSSRPSSPAGSIDLSIRSVSQGPRSVTSAPPNRQPIVARISKYALRLERQYQLGESFIDSVDPEAKYHIRAFQLYRLPARKHGELSLAVIIVEHPGGYNDLRKFMNHGPAWFPADGPPQLRAWDPNLTSDGQHPVGSCTMTQFLSFAIGAAACLQLLHKNTKVIHGELRGDSFYFNESTGSTKWISYGMDVRSFEHGLTSAGWSALTRQFGVEHKLQFIAPEQTGRLPAAPDARTDIYSLGIVFFNFLTGELPFVGETPLDIMQNVLSRRIPPVSTKRLDVPDALSAVIQKMVQRSIVDRYHSAAALKYDLEQIQKFLTEGDREALVNFKVGSRNDNCVFNLPNSLIGRENETKIVLNVIEKLSKRQRRNAPSNTVNVSPLNSESSISLSRRDSESHHMNEDVASEKDSYRSGSMSQNNVGLGVQSDTVDESVEDAFSMDSPRYPPKPYRLSIDKPDSEPNGRSTLSGSTDDAIQMIRNPQRWKRGGRCELIAITGVGKSSFLQSIQPIARSHGYFSIAKFDRNGSTPFQPVLHVMSSLFRQIFSETDINTEFHNVLRSFCRPIWNLLHSMLELPEWLVNATSSSNIDGGTSLASNQDRHRSNTSGTSRRPASPLDLRPSHDSSSLSSAHTTNEFLRSGPGAKNSRFMAIFVDVLRLVSFQKLIVFCLDDIQHADEESLDILQSIIHAKIPMVILVSYRESMSLPLKIQEIMRYDSANVTSLTLHRLTEDQVAEYVADTLHRSKDFVFPLVAILIDKTQGNPFFVREMLEACYREKSLWYSWDDSAWIFDIDKVFKAFESPEYGSQINNDFILARLKRLPSHCRSLLAWASLVGSTFSFSLVKALMRTGGFQNCEWPEKKNSQQASTSNVQRVDLIRQSSQDAIQGLQICLENFVIMAGEDDDYFRFAHDRYQQAAASLAECSNIAEMHFAIARAMISDELNRGSTYRKCNHIVQSAELLKERVNRRLPYRTLLSEAASDAVESGGRSAGLSYYTTAMSLLQDNPWDDKLEDVDYRETIDLYLKCSECYWFQGEIERPRNMLDAILRNAKTTVDKVPAWILQSRIQVRLGDGAGAMKILVHCLSHFAVTIDRNMTWEDCDLQSLKIQRELSQVNWTDIIEQTLTENNVLDSISAVICELLGAAFWIDSLLLYNLSLMAMDIILHRGTTSQAGVMITYYAATVITRFDKVELACELASAAKSFFYKFSDDLFSVGRGQNLASLLLNHFEGHLQGLIPVLEGALMASISSGDRMAAIINVGFTASLKIWSSHDLADVEHYCTYGAEELGEWQDDLRGGVFITSVRQLARALQGKTNCASAEQIFTDENHDTVKYWKHLQSHSSGPLRVWNAYAHFQVTALVLFGHWHAAIKLLSSKEQLKVDNSVLKVNTTNELNEIKRQYWSSRFGVNNSYYVGIAYMAIVRGDPGRDDSESMVAWVRAQTEKLRIWGSVNDTNFHIFEKTLQAQLNEYDGDLESATRGYESALDHAEVHGFILDMALTSELYAEFLIRRGANRPAANAIRDAIAAYRRVSAAGKADHIATKHEWLLKGTSSLNKVDAGSQTTALESAYIDHVQNTKMEQSPGKRTTEENRQSWNNLQNKNDSRITNTSLQSLDVIDITSILKSSQVLSSELQIDRLLAKMTKIIIDMTGGELCAIVVQDHEGETDWKVAAISDREGNDYPSNESLENVDDVVGRQVTLFCLRFKEPVFLNNVFSDDRFSNISEAYRKRKPDGKSIIAMPIIHSDQVVRGCLYLEGPVNSFTERIAAVLQLLVAPVSISITNAMLFNRAEKASANNAVMVEAQKYALSQARTAEKKAKKAEAEATRNARLKEEAAAAKSMFLASVSHELRTPLNGVIGMSELLKQTALNSEQESYADSIRVCADTLLTVINDILDFSKLEAGKMRMFSVPLNLSETISEVVRALSYGNMEKNLHTVMKLDIDEDLLVIADPIRLHQVMMNLLSNAFKFCPSGTITVRAVVERETDQEIEVTCSVTDTGIGIAEEQKQKLFLPFSQADNSTARTYGGTGLGLTICKAIIENLMKGKIWLESKVNVGTTASFRLTFPKVIGGSASQTLKPKVAADPMAVYSPEEILTQSIKNSNSTSTPAKISRDTLRICIAEDNPINQKIAISFVQKLGFKCEAYNDGRQAVEALAAASAKGDPFGIVLMDCQMPVMDGYDATREIRKHPEGNVRNVVIIAMTASAIRGDREKCLEAGMNNYLAKPVRQQALKQMLDGYVDQPVLPVKPKMQRKVTARKAVTTRNSMDNGIVEVNNNDGSTTSADHGVSGNRNDDKGTDGSGLGSSSRAGLT